MLALAACHHQLDDVDAIFDDGTGPAVHCAVDLDVGLDTSNADIDGALDRAAARGEIVELYAHHPGVTVSLDVIEHVVAGAEARGLASVQYRDFAAGTAIRPGLALSFDDTSVQAWVDALPVLARHGARVTFFVSRFTELTELEHAELHQLADAGHDIEAHSVKHLRAPEFVEMNGLAAYLTDEAQPSIDRLADDGFPIAAYAYPFGARTATLDRALLGRVAVLRSVAFPWSAGVESPCPR